MQSWLSVVGHMYVMSQFGRNRLNYVAKYNGTPVGDKIRDGFLGVHQKSVTNFVTRWWNVRPTSACCVMISHAKY